MFRNTCVYLYTIYMYSMCVYIYTFRTRSIHNWEMLPATSCKDVHGGAKALERSIGWDFGGGLRLLDLLDLDWDLRGK